MQSEIIQQSEAVNKAFSKQSVHYDADDRKNIVLQHMREQVYDHVFQFLKPKSRILELNAGTGIDAMKFLSRGHSVIATDVSDGMIAEIQKKILAFDLGDRLQCIQLGYENLDQLKIERKFDCVFSNFGGLNCIEDLSLITRHLPSMLNPGATVTWVIMPRVCLWEIAGLVKGHGKKAFRRLARSGVASHLEGEFFRTYYHSLSDISHAFQNEFKLTAFEGLAALSPPPHRSDFPLRHPTLYNSLRKTDRLVRHWFPFNRWADHIIVTFRFTP